jgi:hypothetical protein
VAERVLQPAAARAGDVVEQLPARRREPDEAGAAVGGVAAADDEPARLQLADLAADDRLRHPALRGEPPEPALGDREQARQLFRGERVPGRAGGVREGVHETDDRLPERVHRVGRRRVGRRRVDPLS